MDVGICENTFFDWVNRHELFRECYSVGKMYAREMWELEGQRLRDYTNPPGVIDHAFDHWRMIGWSRFGISKNSRIKLNLNPDDNPNKHYQQILKQANSGDFTASEIKQLMEAVNVGLNSHQVIEMQKEINQLKSDLETMRANSGVKNTFTDKGTA